MDSLGLFPGTVKIFFFSSVQTDSGAHTVSYPICTRGFSPGLKWQGLEADHSPPSSAEVMKGGAIPPFHVFMVCLTIFYLYDTDHIENNACNNSSLPWERL
jgi:hypothetical protein